LEVAGKAFGRSFATPKDLCDFIDAVPKREMQFQDSLIAAGWRAKKKKPTRRISLEKADLLFSTFVERISEANANREFAFFVQEVLVYGSYLRRQNTVGDIDIAMQFAMKTNAKLNERISFYLRKGAAVDWKEGYGLAIGEVSNFLTKRSKYFHDADSATVKRSYPYQLVYAMPELQEYVRLVDQTPNSASVDHLHQFLEQAERREKSKQRHALTSATKSNRKPRRT
jgi:predicted nucleotidyltransferase